MSCMYVVAAGYKLKCFGCGKEVNHHICFSSMEIETGEAVTMDGFIVCTECYKMSMLTPVTRMARTRGIDLITKTLATLQKAKIPIYSIPGIYLNKSVCRAYIVERTVMGNTDIIIPLSKISVKAYAAAGDNDIRLTKHGQAYLMATLAKDTADLSNVPPTASERYIFANNTVMDTGMPGMYTILNEIAEWMDNSTAAKEDDKTKPLPLIDRTSSLPALTTTVNNTGSAYMSVNTSAVYKPKPTTLYGEWS